MPRAAESTSREKLLRAATEAFRQRGFDAVSVDDICTAAGVSKGAFFHHFASKEAIAEACLTTWKKNAARLSDHLEETGLTDPSERLFALLDRFTALVTDTSGAPPACLAGALTQECAESHPRLRNAAQDCFADADSFIGGLIAAAAAQRGAPIDAVSLARLWMAAVQGGLILFKASQNVEVLTTSLRHVREYIRIQLDTGDKPSG